MIKFFSYLSPNEIRQLSCKEKYRVFGSITNNKITCPCKCSTCGEYLVIGKGYLQCSNCSQIYPLYKYDSMKGKKLKCL